MKERTQGDHQEGDDGVVERFAEWKVHAGEDVAADEREQQHSHEAEDGHDDGVDHVVADDVPGGDIVAPAQREADGPSFPTVLEAVLEGPGDQQVGGDEGEQQHHSVMNRCDPIW